jgi:hypothetical protein
MRVMKRLLVAIAMLGTAASAASAQTLSAWESFDFAHKRVDSADVAKLSLPALRSLIEASCSVGTGVRSPTKQTCRPT